MANLKRISFLFPRSHAGALLVVGVVLLFQSLFVLGKDQVRSRIEAHILESERTSNYNLDAYQNVKEDGSDREARLWTLFRRSSTSNPSCVSSSGRQGTCRSRKSCEKSNGMVISNSCGNKGTNVCCLARARCSATNSERPILINSTGTHMYPPATYTTPISCRYEIARRPGVCQIRLDFITFEMAQPSETGDCVDDALTIAGSDNLRNFQICGNNKDQHLYLHYGSSNLITLTTRLRSLVKPAVFDIVATYINCNEDGNRAVPKTKGKNSGRRFSSSNNNDNDDDDDADMPPASTAMAIPTEPAPIGCTQYFTRSTDSVQSFNYGAYSSAAGMAGAAAGAVADNLISYQLNNQRYTVCIKSNAGISQITWQTCTNGAFAISGMLPTQNVAARQGQACPIDYVDIPGGNKGARYCGTAFPGPVTSVLKPFLLGVNFDEVELLGPNFEMNPVTGCCIFCECKDGNGDVVNQLCTPPVFNCELNENLKDRSDSNNIGFCLTYTLG